MLDPPSSPPAEEPEDEEHAPVAQHARTSATIGRLVMRIPLWSS